MVSGRLIRLVEDHKEQIANNVLGEIHKHPELAHIRSLPDAELRERGQMILENLGHWLSGHEAELERRYEALGEARFEESIPLQESVRALAIVKHKMLDFVHYQGMATTSLNLYAEQELQRRVGRFFDELTIHMVRGYETAWQRDAHVNA